MKNLQEQAPVLRPSIYQLAETQHLGTLQAAYTVPGKPVLISLGTFFSGGITGIPLIFVLAAAIPSGAAVLVYFLALILLTALVFWVRLKRNGQICLYDSGLIWAYGSSTKALRWEHIETFKRGTLETDPPRVDDLDWIQITGPNYLEFSMPKSLLNKDRAFLCDTIEREFVHARLPEAIEQFKAGKPVIFRGISGLKGGTLSVSQKGLTNGEETLPWHQVESFNIDATIVSICQKGRTSSWLSNYVAQFPNACLLKALEEQTRGQRWGMRREQANDYRVKQAEGAPYQFTTAKVEGPD